VSESETCPSNYTQTRTLKMMLGRVLFGLALAILAEAQTVRPPTPMFTPCDLVFDIPM
jgi:hypothetical protein